MTPDPAQYLLLSERRRCDLLMAAGDLLAFAILYVSFRKAGSE